MLVRRVVEGEVHTQISRHPMTGRTLHPLSAGRRGSHTSAPNLDEGDLGMTGGMLDHGRQGGVLVMMSRV